MTPISYAKHRSDKKPITLANNKNESLFPNWPFVSQEIKKNLGNKKIDLKSG